MSEITQLLNAAHSGENVEEKLLNLVYHELKAIAGAKLAREHQNVTLQPTALVHEAWLRLTDSAEMSAYGSRAHFFGAAAEAMRRILIEKARRRVAAKRGSGVSPVNIDDVEIASVETTDERLLALDEALEKFVKIHPKKAELVKLRYFVGLTFDEAAPLLSIAVSTAKQWWAFARAWIAVEMEKTLEP